MSRVGGGRVCWLSCLLTSKGSRGRGTEGCIPRRVTDVCYLTYTYMKPNNDAPFWANSSCRTSGQGWRVISVNRRCEERHRPLSEDYDFARLMMQNFPRRSRSPTNARGSWNPGPTPSHRKSRKYRVILVRKTRQQPVPVRRKMYRAIEKCMDPPVRYSRFYGPKSA